MSTSINRETLELLGELRRRVTDLFGEFAGVPPEWEQLISQLESTWRDHVDDDFSTSSQTSSSMDLESIINALPDLLLFVTTDGDVLDFRLGNSTVVKLPAEIPFVKRIQDLPRIGRQFGDALERTRATNSLVSFEYTLPYQGESLHYEARFLQASAGHVLILIRDITKRKKAEDALREKIVHLELLKKLQEHLADAFDVETIVRRVQELLPPHLGIDRATLLVFDEQRQSFEGGLVLASDEEDQASHPLPRPIELSLARKAYAERKAIVIDDCSNTGLLPPSPDDRLRIKSMCAIPVVAKQTVKGVLQIEYTDLLHRFSASEIEFYTMLGEHIGLMLENAKLFAEQDLTREVLRQSEQSYYHLFEDVPVGLYRAAPDGRLLDVNTQFVQSLRYQSREALVNVRVHDLFLKAEMQALWTDRLAQSDTVNGFEAEMVCSNGDVIWARLSVRSSRNESGTLTGYEGVLENITDRRKAEGQVTAAIHEKEILLKEIHHRVKNNLQIISSLLNLQSSHLRDPFDVQLFRESQNRVKAMSLLHEKLYESEDFARIDFAEYLHALVATLFQSYKTGEAAIDSILDVDEIRLDIDTAIPCGLIVGELVSNSLKHAFPDQHGGTIRVAFHKAADGTNTLSVSDDGVGMMPDEERKETASLGLELVDTLVSQLSAGMKIAADHGTTTIITFKDRTR